MNIKKNAFLSLVYFGVVVTTVSCSQFGESEKSYLNSIEYVYPISRTSEGKVPYDVIDLENPTTCGEGRGQISPESLSISKNEYNRLWVEITRNIRKGVYYKFNYGECGKDGVVITNIKACTKEICDPRLVVDTTKLWLNNDSYSPLGLVEGRAESADYFIQPPLEKDPESGLFKFKAMHRERPDAIAIDAYIDNQDISKAHFILEYRSYYSSGNPLLEETYDTQGNKQGKSILYYDSPNRIHRITYYKNDKLDGEYTLYHENGKIENNQHYNNGNNITSNGVIYDKNGNVVERYSYNEQGKLDGEQVKYYPNGKIKEKNIRKDGEIVGTIYYYWPNGRIQRKSIYQPNNSHSESWYENGIKKDESYTRGKEEISKHWYENGQQGSYERYIKGKSHLLKKWSKNGIQTSYYEELVGKRTISKGWDDNGRLRYSSISKENGESIQEEWDKDGDRAHSKTWNQGKDEHREEKRWSKNGKLQSFVYLVNGEIITRKSW